MVAADALIKQTQDALKALERSAAEATMILQRLKTTPGQATETVESIKVMEREVKKLEGVAASASAELKDVKLGAAAAAETAANAEIEKRALKGIEDQAIKTRVATAAAESSGYDWAKLLEATQRFDRQARQFGAPVRTDSGAIPLQGGTSYVGGTSAYRRALDDLLMSQRGAGGGLMMGPGPTLRSAGSFGSEDLGSFFGTPRGTGEEAARRYLESHGIDIGRGGGGGFGGGGGGGRGGFGNGGDFTGRGLLGGVLPGGRRASAGAVTTAIGLALASAPGLAPGLAGGAAAIAPAALESLAGGALSLKLAFADLTAAAFTQQKAFDLLTPTQQHFVQSLRQLDAGFVKPLERLAQGAVLPKLTDALQRALTPQAVGVARASVDAFGSAVGGGAQQFGSLVGSRQFLNAFGPVLQADARYLRDFIGGITNLFDALVHLQQAAIPFTNWIDKGVLGFTQWADRSIKAAQATGQLAHFFDMAKQSLQAMGTLLGSIGHLASGLFDAVGFQNSLGVIRLIAGVINQLGSFLHANAATFRNFFAGALQSAHDLLTLTKGFMAVLTPLLSLLDRVAHALGGWRIIIDALIAYKFAQVIRGWSLAMGAYTLATEGAAGATLALETLLTGGLLGLGIAIGVAVGYVIAHWHRMTAAMTQLWQAALKSIKGALDLFVYATLYGFLQIAKIADKAFSWVPIIGPKIHHALGEVEGYIEGFKTRGIEEFGSAGALMGSAWGTAFTGQAQASLTAVSGAFAQWETNQKGALAALAAQGFTTDLMTGKSVTVKGSVVPKINTALPQKIQDQIAAASAGHGDQTKAAAAAYAYYEKLLKTPGLSQAQKTAIYNAEAPYAPSPYGKPPPLQGQGAAGTVLTPDMQQALATASATPGTKDDIKTMTAAIKYLQGHMAEFTKTQKTEAEKQIASFEKSIASLEKQAKTAADQAFRLRIQEHHQTLAGAMQSFVTGTDVNNAPRDRVQAAQTLIKVAQAQKRELDTMLQQATTEKERLAVQHELLNVEKDIARAKKAERQAVVSGQIDRILGIGASNSTPGTQSLLTRERQILLAEIARVTPHGKGVTAAQAAEMAIPGAINEPIEKLIKDMQAHGIKIPKSTLDSLHKINEAIERARKAHEKLSTAQSQNISARLTQINDTLKTLLGGKDTGYRVPTEKQLTAGIAGLTPEQRKEIGARMAEVADLGGMVPTVGAAGGVPLTHGGSGVTVDAHGRVTHRGHRVTAAPELVSEHGGLRRHSAPDLTSEHGKGGGYTVIGPITIKISGEHKTPQQIAAEVRNEILKGARRNPTQTRGPNAGRNRGMN